MLRLLSRLAITAAVMAAAPATFARAAKPANGIFLLISSNARGEPANNTSRQPAISPDGRKVAFVSVADNLVPDDTNLAEDVFVKDVRTGSITRVSVREDGSQTGGGKHSFAPVFSPNGRKIYFVSYDSGFVPGDTNGDSDIFEKDLVTGKVRRVSVNAVGGQLDGYSDRPSISKNGRFLAFDSPATNAVPGDRNRTSDVFVKDLLNGKVTRISVGRTGGDANNFSFFGSFSPNGRLVTFESYASNLVAGDTNSGPDIFVKPVKGGKAVQVSLSESGGQGAFGGTPITAEHGPVFSPNGRTVAFQTAADGLSLDGNPGADDVFIKTLKGGAIVNATLGRNGSVGKGSTRAPKFSTDGRWLVFFSSARGLVAGTQSATAQIYARNLKGASKLRPLIIRLSETRAGAPGNGGSVDPAVGPKGLVAFATGARNIAKGASNNRLQIVLTRLP